MKILQFVTGVTLALLVACARSGMPTHRVELRRISGDTVQIVPGENQMPYCLVFTHSGKGVVRQLTMSKNNVSVRCNAGEPVLGQGRVRLLAAYVYSIKGKNLQGKAPQGVEEP